jgi:hypothetical protein
VKTVFVILSFVALAFSQEWTNYNPKARRANLADSATGSVHAIASDSAYKMRDTITSRLGIAAPVFTATKIKLHGVVIDSISVIDASGTSADTLIFGIGGKAFKVWSDVGQ